MNHEPCPCGSGRDYAVCCGRLHAGGELADSAEALMRSRYSAFVLRRADYLLATWHPSTRPEKLDLADDATKWLGLSIRATHRDDEMHARVEFVAQYRVAGRGYRLHETSSFVREGGCWLYVDGEINVQ